MQDRLPAAAQWSCEPRPRVASRFAAAGAASVTDAADGSDRTDCRIDSQLARNCPERQELSWARFMQGADGPIEKAAPTLVLLGLGPGVFR
jgi:hypothetical protein